MLEQEIEKYFVRLVAKRLKGYAFKFTSPARRSVPDRIVVAPGSICFFAEMKATGKEPTEKQMACIKKIRRCGIPVHVIDSKLMSRGIVEIYYKIQEKRLG